MNYKELVGKDSIHEMSFLILLKLDKADFFTAMIDAVISILQKFWILLRKK